MYGRLVDSHEDFRDMRFVRLLTFEVNPNDIKTELPEHCELTIVKWSPERNLNQNSKYWKIVGDIARLTQQPKSAVHNHLLNEYGEIEYKDGIATTVSMKRGFNYLEDDEMHLKPTGQSFMLAHEVYDIYYKLVASHNLTKQQFSRLVDGAIEELGEVLNG